MRDAFSRVEMQDVFFKGGDARCFFLEVDSAFVAD